MAEPDKTHTVVAIGYLGGFVCFLDVSVEEAKRRYAERSEWPSLDEARIKTLTFVDRFEAYDIFEAADVI